MKTRNNLHPPLCGGCCFYTCWSVELNEMEQKEWCCSMVCRILLTGFQNTSSEQLLLTTHGIDTLLLPNDRIKSAQLLACHLFDIHYDLVICTGQRPKIKNKVYIETTAKENGVVLKTTVDCQSLAHIFEMYGICAKLSHNAGSSFCNALYFNALQLVEAHNLCTRFVFVHIPFLKNISSMGDFKKCFYNVLENLKKNGVQDLWMR